MFQQTFVPQVRTSRKPIGMIVSLVSQSLLVALLVLAPILVTQPLPREELRSLILSPTPLVTPEKPIARNATVAQISVDRVRPFRLTAPVILPNRINTPVEVAPEAPDIGATTGFAAGGDSALGGLGGSVNSVPPFVPKEPLKTKESTGPIVVGGNVAAANLIHKAEPGYPPLAKAARIQGEVVFRAVIGIDGQIRNLQLQVGHPLLVAAARNAILQWRYRPTLLNGKPVEVVTTITVHFALSQ